MQTILITILIIVIIIISSLLVFSKKCITSYDSQGNKSGGCFYVWQKEWWGGIKDNTTIVKKLTAQLRHFTSAPNVYSDDSLKEYEIKKGDVVNLKSQDNDNKTRYSFEVVDIQTDSVFLKQIADELGNKNTEGLSISNQIFELKTGQSFVININSDVPGGGLRWNILIK